jgi:hypothetical protein
MHACRAHAGSGALWQAPQRTPTASPEWRSHLRADRRGTASQRAQFLFGGPQFPDSCSDAADGVLTWKLQPKGFGRIRLRRIENDFDECVVPLVQEFIQPGTVMVGSELAAHVSMADVHRVASLVKRWIWELIMSRRHHPRWSRLTNGAPARVFHQGPQQRALHDDRL